MAKLTFDQDTFELTPSKSVLENLLERGHQVPNSCRAGICQACKVQVVSGRVSPQAQQGLPASLTDQGVFLACCCFPSEDLGVQLMDANQLSHEAEVLDHSMLSDDVLRLRLESDVKWQAGQVINCVKDDTVIRSYSIASRPADGFMELHIRVYPNGQFSQWAKTSLKVGDTMRIEPPFGDCVYDPASYEQPLVMAATGTGLAPIYGVLKDALANYHQGHISLYVASGEADGFYFLAQLEALARKHSAFQLHKVVRRGEGLPSDFRVGNVEEIVLADYPSLKNHRVYLCGAPEMVSQLTKKAFMRGVRREHIHSDPFESAQT
jgi:NAD(P)H-flavin reductase/ferredoxin